jgi:hypothetical protein
MIYRLKGQLPGRAIHCDPVKKAMSDGKELFPVEAVGIGSLVCAAKPTDAIIPHVGGNYPAALHGFASDRHIQDLDR